MRSYWMDDESSLGVGSGNIYIPDAIREQSFRKPSGRMGDSQGEFTWRSVRVCLYVVDVKSAVL